MGFRSQAFCKVWEITPQTDTRTKGRISISRKNRQTGEYETDFSGFVSFLGTAAAKKAAILKEGDRIRLGDVDVSNRYDKERQITYTNFNIFSFETQDEVDGVNNTQTTGAGANSGGIDFVYEGFEGDPGESRLPF